MNMMRKVAEEEAQPGLKFKIVERGGEMIKGDQQNTNPSWWLSKWGLSSMQGGERERWSMQEIQCTV